MKAIIALLLVILLGGAGVAPMATGDGAEFFYRYMLDNTLIVAASDPPPDLVVNGENPWGGAIPGSSKVFQVDDVWPGDSGNATLELQNIGDPGTLQLHFLDLQDFEMGCNEPESLVDSTCGDPGEGEGELSQNLDMLIWWDNNQNNEYDAGETKIAEGKLKDIACITYDLGILGNMETKYLEIAWSVDNSVGNEIMGDKCTFDIQFALD